MNDKQKNILIPKLRFPEFKDSGEWEEKKLGEITVITTGTSNREDSTKNKGKYTFFDRSEDIRTSDKFLFDTEAIIVGGEGQKFIPKYFIGKFDLHQRAYAIKNFEDNNFGKYLYYYIYQNRGYFLQYAVGSTVKSLRLPIFEKMPILIPQLAEQQKIASCLSSLDELLEARKQKLELLKAHKKGLMQNLFPQEGEKVPKLRFPEFKNSGEWKEKKLGEIGKPLMCKRIFKEQTSSNPNDGVPFYKIGTFGRVADSFIPTELYNEYKRKYSFPKVGDILISASGTIGRLVIYDGAPAYFQDSNIIWLGHYEEVISNSFLFYCYSMVKWQTSDGGVIRRLYNSDFMNIKIIFPKNKKEQQKIAECLSSVDELFTAEADKIEQLEKHKKGLMQGLFPEIN